ncbi:MAG TPA: UDP-N-acetylglucosamine--N-acetylmuramyl-(pentapeptide) pyrophosphoryl-undecaprenol N-acetylglucosamine transferase, partial [Verrucomicrobia bacterium]|nr:UDP-N-acetylglucosamine--N-acetylmuramyl-(pentapeptide) pyrophosphoryl-undecaprenol N-acetylglucosamine transferase [Verrucomicrobiota bacterium]
MWLAGRDVEASSIAGWQGRVVKIRASGFPSGRIVVAVVSVWRLLGAFRSAWLTMRAMRPDVLLCMGSYASVAPCLAARCVGIPVVLHEANAVPGRAISFLSRFASRVAVGFEEALAYVPRGKAVVTGFPLRRGFAPSAPRTAGKSLSLLVMGGSQGARVLNERMPRVASALQAHHEVCVVHLAGRQSADAVEAAYRDHKVNAQVFAFSSDMATLYA